MNTSAEHSIRRLAASSVALFVTAIVVLGAPAARADSQSFSGAADFSPSSNPSGPWSYGWSLNGSSFSLLDQSQQISGLDVWTRSTEAVEPDVFHNGTDQTINPAGTNPIPPGQLAAHPGSAGERAIVRFTVPATATYSVSASFKGLDVHGTSTDVHVFHDGAQLFGDEVSGYQDTRSFDGVVSAGAGDTIDLAVGFGTNGNYFYDSTGIDVLITQTDQVTTTTVTSSTNPSVLNAPVTFTAEVSAASGVPNGDVQWQIDGANVGTPVALDASGIAMLTTSTLSVTQATPHSVEASYLGGAGFLPSAGGLAQSVRYASSGTCAGSAGHQVLQPINADGTSVFKAKSTVTTKFRVCDANGVSIGTAGVVSSFRLTQTITGTAVQYVDEAVSSGTPDSEFRWDQTAQQWIYNISTKEMAAGSTYVYAITLNDGSTIVFQFGLR